MVAIYHKEIFSQKKICYFNCLKSYSYGFLKSNFVYEMCRSKPNFRLLNHFMYDPSKLI